MGIRGLTVSSKTEKPSGVKISNKIEIMSYFEEISQNKFIGERLDIFKTSILKKYKYPISEAKFIPEIWLYVNTASVGYKFIYIPENIGYFYDETEENRLTRSSILIHAKGHYISRSAALKKVPNYVWAKNPLFFCKTLIRFSQTACVENITFKQRINDTNLIFSLISYMLFFFVYWTK